jgi:thioesterase domain-containing protein
MSETSFASEWARSHEPGGRPPRCMIPLADGTGTPLYLVHWVLGNIAFVRDFAEVFSGGHPVFGFEATGLRDRRRPLLSVAEMADRYLREIKQVQPRGPYRLGGLCSGSQIAFEMACRLVAAGEEVGPLLLVNGGRGELLAHPPLGLEDHYELRLAELCRQFSVTDLRADAGRVMKALRELRWIDEDAAEEDFYWHQVIYAANAYAHQRVRLSRYAGPVELFLCGWAASDRSSAWGEVAPDCRVRVFSAETTIEILRSPVFAAIAGQGFRGTARRCP